MAKKNIYDDSSLILKGGDVPGHTKYLQGLDLPIKVNSIIEYGKLELSDVAGMHIADVNGVSTLVITPELVGQVLTGRK